MTWMVSLASEYLYEMHCDPSMVVNIGERKCLVDNGSKMGFLVRMRLLF